MTTSTSYRWRKATDINREHALFELLEGKIALLDVGFSDGGTLEVSFNPGVSGKVISWDTVRELLEEGKALAERDR